MHTGAVFVHCPDLTMGCELPLAMVAASGESVRFPDASNSKAWVLALAVFEEPLNPLLVSHEQQVAFRCLLPCGF